MCNENIYTWNIMKRQRDAYQKHSYNTTARCVFMASSYLLFKCLLAKSSKIENRSFMICLFSTLHSLREMVLICLSATNHKLLWHSLILVCSFLDTEKKKTDKDHKRRHKSRSIKSPTLLPLSLFPF